MRCTTMKLTTTKSLDEKQEIIVLGMFEDGTENYASLDKNFAEELAEAKSKNVFTGKFGEVYPARFKGKKAVVIGLGKGKEFTVERLRRIFGKAVKNVKSTKAGSFTANIPEVVRALKKFSDKEIGRAVAEAILLSNYSFTKYLSKERREKMRTIDTASLQWENAAPEFEKGLNEGKVIAESANYVKDLVNEPASVCNSLYLEKEARKLAAGNKNITLKVLNEAEMKKLGMGALLGVNAGSDNPPKLLFLEYNDGSKSKPTAIVGKGITFDSGGYNLKPTKYIEEMKTDMGGAAAVLGVIKAAASLGVKKNLVGVMALCENMVSSSAQRPGDIVKAYNGKTIEIGNTDAEGRLVLADALSYTEKKYAPEVMIDLATLTGACIVAYGYYVAGLMGNDEKLLAQLKQAGLDSGDKVWPMPFFEEYQDWMDGSISDLNNVPNKGKGYEGGTITAGVFLGKFVENTKWAHIDLGGAAYWGVEGDYVGKGASGSGVRVLMYWLLG